MQDSSVDEYRKDLSTSIFSCMELSGQSYPETMSMPVQRFYDYLKWKSDLEEEKQKLIKEKTEGG